MKTPLWTLLFLCLCVPGRCDCQRDCVSCGLIWSEQQAFNTLMCLLECEALIAPALTWDLCQSAVGLTHLSLQPQDGGGIVSKRADDGVLPLAAVSLEEDGGGLEYSEALERFRHAVQALESWQPRGEKEQTAERLGTSYNSEQLSARTEEEEEAEKEADERDSEEGEERTGEAAIGLSKRFGGFLKGRHSYRKLQKRYGGFIGLRKSARKWNNQKRVSRLLRQYLSLTGHARLARPTGRFTNLSSGKRQRNEV